MDFPSHLLSSTDIRPDRGTRRSRLGMSSSSQRSPLAAPSALAAGMPPPPRRSIRRPSRPRNTILPWSVAYDTKRDIPAQDGEGTFRVYYSGEDHEGPVFFFVHGAGFSALSFGLLVKRISPEVCCIAPDLRAHGATLLPSTSTDCETLLQDLEYIVAQTTGDRPLVLVGHSLGGALTSKLAARLADRVIGLCVIDVCEGTATASLPNMRALLERRPRRWRDWSSLIRWLTSSRTLLSASSARLSAGGIGRQSERGVLAVTDLMGTAPNWAGWFRGMGEAFHGARCPRILMVSHPDKMDKECLIGQMQGKFTLKVVPRSGHSLMEDNPDHTAQALLGWARRFHLTAALYGRQIVPGSMQEGERVPDLRVMAERGEISEGEGAVRE